MTAREQLALEQRLAVALQREPMRAPGRSRSHAGLGAAYA